MGDLPVLACCRRGEPLSGYLEGAARASVLEHLLIKVLLGVAMASWSWPSVAHHATEHPPFLNSLSFFFHRHLILQVIHGSSLLLRHTCWRGKCLSVNSTIFLLQGHRHVIHSPRAGRRVPQGPSPQLSSELLPFLRPSPRHFHHPLKVPVLAQITGSKDTVMIAVRPRV